MSNQGEIVEGEQLRRSCRSRASAALFYAQLEELTKNLKPKPTVDPLADYLPYKRAGTLTQAYVKFIVLQPKDSSKRIHKKKQYDNEIYDLDLFKMEKTKVIKKNKLSKPQLNSKKQQSNNSTNQKQVLNNPNNGNNLIQMLISCAEQALDQKNEKENKSTLQPNQSIAPKKTPNLKCIKKANLTQSTLELEHTQLGSISFFNKNSLFQKKFNYDDCNFKELFSVGQQQPLSLKDIRTQFQNQKLSIPIYGTNHS